MSDANNKVNHPNHYTQSGIECIAAIFASMDLTSFTGYCQGNIMKYLWRHKTKGGVTDLRKAAVYLQWMINAYEDNIRFQQRKE